MIFKQSNLIIALSIGLQIQSGNVNAFGLSDVTNAVDQVNSVAKQLNVPQPIPTSPTPTATASTITEIPNEFQGKWVTNQNNCVGNPDSGVVDIEKNRFYLQSLLAKNLKLFSLLLLMVKKVLRLPNKLGN